ncbi:hypothetical protein D0U04_03080 [Bacillus clarus]|uniref:Pectate lyase superfamily protein domain-containing protein n=1 Tax=Bacillus clarus TaxID=2338372 RepID=A0A090YW66_9BACI|nr:hypothetical protein [Bacillus clarus]KFN02228.1 hypothetical protein DJ93_4063 [Bacillus clarus]RFT68450.1 hypothetical protein D0U04_03080 [Bacillus clarus]
MSEYISSQEDCAPGSSVHIDCFGAVPNSGNDSSVAIQQAIDYCVANRISTVRITGVNTYKILKAIVIKENVRLELDPTVTVQIDGNFNAFELQKNASITGGNIQVVNPVFQSSVIYVPGSQQIEVPNQSVISNINIINTTSLYKGIAIHFYCQKAWDYISFFQVNFIQIKNFQIAIYLKTEYVEDINTPCWINANVFQSIFIDGCQYGIEVDGSSDLPNESSGNTFSGIQVQCRQQTKKVIRCSGAYNSFDCMIWDTYRMSSEPIVIEFSSNSHRNYLFSNLLSTTIVDKGQYNVCTSTYEQSLRIQLPLTLNKPHLIGNQDDILVNAPMKYSVKQVAGKLPYGGNLANCFNLIDEQSVNYIDIPDNNPVVFELDFTKNPIKMLNCLGLYFGWGESPKKIRIEYLLSANGNWVIASDVPLNVGDTIISNMKASQLYKVRITMSGYAQEHKRFRINRIFARSSMESGNAWLATTGGKIFGDIELEASKGVIMKTASGGKWRVTIDEAGQLITTKIT